MQSWRQPRQHELPRDQPDPGWGFGGACHGYHYAFVVLCYHCDEHACAGRATLIASYDDERHVNQICVDPGCDGEASDHDCDDEASDHDCIGVASDYDVLEIGHGVGIAHGFVGAVGNGRGFVGAAGNGRGFVDVETYHDCHGVESVHDFHDSGAAIDHAEQASLRHVRA